MSKQIDVEKVVAAYVAAYALLGEIGKEGQVDSKHPASHLLLDELGRLDGEKYQPEKVREIVEQINFRLRYAENCIETMGREIIRYTKGSKSMAAEELEKHLAIVRGEVK